RGYLDDAKFAATFVRSLAANKSQSKRQVQLALRKKGISSEIIDQVIANTTEYSEVAALKKLIAKKSNHYDDQQKLIAYLVKRGFRYDDIKNTLDTEV
ncbi:MAG: RecX family transcriptional regulator, partial [Candidatus Nomurabacteria bacterium]|nr:RecX family transcriptional regulator [Candidatus Nomurabacteria bacterium]